MSRIITSQDESKRRFKVGSQAFFEGMPGFQPRDLDEVEFEDEPRLYRNVMQFRKKDGTRCLFKWRRMTADEFIDYTLKSKLPMEIGKFLIPEIAEYLGITLDHLKRLKPVAERLDERHAYERIILESYLENGALYLTDEQRRTAYGEYKRARNK